MGCLVSVDTRIWDVSQSPARSNFASRSDHYDEESE